jgi:hypothetical protein
MKAAIRHISGTAKILQPAGEQKTAPEAPARFFNVSLQD